MEPTWFSDQTGLNIFYFGSDLAEQIFIFRQKIDLALTVDEPTHQIEYFWPVQ